MNGRSLAVFSYLMPTLALDGTALEYVQFLVESNSTTTPIQLYLQRRSLDLSNIEEEDYDLPVENGKVLRLSIGDPTWCSPITGGVNTLSNNCSMLLVVSTMTGGMYRVSARPKARRDLLLEQVPLTKVFGI